MAGPRSWKTSMSLKKTHEISVSSRAAYAGVSTNKHSKLLIICWRQIAIKIQTDCSYRHQKCVPTVVKQSASM